VTWPESVREFVSARASRKCEYCLLDQADAGLPHEIDHVISRKHGGTQALENLAYACYLCNRYKGSDIASLHPQTGRLVRLLHPRQDRWTDHFRIAGPILEPLTEIGLATAVLLRLNVADRVAERKLLQSLGRYPRVLSS
jgi:hypothetical protein